MRRILFLLCLLFPLLANAGSQYRLTKIMVTGSRRYSDSDLVRATGLTVNTQVTLDDLQNAGARMGSSGVFSLVQFIFKPGSANSVEADFTVKDADRFLPAVFENIVWLTDPELQSALHDALPLFNGMIPASGSMPDDVVAALSKILSAKGLPSDVSYIPKADFGKPISSYNYKVNNAGLKIGPVNLIGASHLGPNALAQSVASLQGHDYLRSDVEVVLKQNLLPLYGSYGFLRTTIGEIKPTLNNGVVEIQATVSEGTQYRLAGYSWSGNTLVSSDELSKRITLKSGEPVNAPKLERELNAARKLFGKFGHEAALIIQVPTFEGDTVLYRFEVKEGELYRMGKLDVVGPDPQRQRMLELWKLKEGMAYDNTYFKQMTDQLKGVAGPKSTRWKVIEHLDDTTHVVDVRVELETT